MPDRPSPRSVNPLLPWGFGLWAVTYIGARLVIESRMAEGLGRGKLLVALIPLPFFVGWMVGLIREVRGMDELQRRIQLEALGIAFPLTLLLVMTLGLVEAAQPLDPDNWSFRHIWPFLMLFYITGLAIARRRYRFE